MRRIVARPRDGFRSGFEARFALDLQQRGIEYEYEADSFTYTVHRKYTPDFKHKKKSGGVFYAELKGFLTREDRSKTLRVLSQHPKLDLRFVFQNAQNKLGDGSRTTYAQWCDKQGIKWAQGTIPEAWLNE